MPTKKLNVQAELKNMRLKMLLAQVSRTNAKVIGVSIEIGTLLIEAKENKSFLGTFHSWCKAEFGLEKTARCDYMKVSRNQEIIGSAQAWAEQHNIQCETLTDIVRLISRFERRDETPKPRKEPTAISATEAHRSKLVFALWERPTTPVGEADNAELRLHRFAMDHDLSLKRYLAKLDLAIPEHRRPRAGIKSLAA